MTTLHEAAQQALEALLSVGICKRADGTYFDSDCTFTFAITALREALAQQGEQPVAWPQTPEQISDFIGSNFVWREGNDVAPKDGDKYCVTAHDLLSAFREWPEFAAAPAAQSVDGPAQEVIRIQPDGRVVWRGREVESDADFRAAMMDLLLVMAPAAQPDKSALWPRWAEQIEADVARPSLFKKFTE